MSKPVTPLELLAILHRGFESKDLDYKGPCSWDESAQKRLLQPCKRHPRHDQRAGRLYRDRRIGSPYRIFMGWLGRGPAQDVRHIPPQPLPAKLCRSADQRETSQDRTWRKHFFIIEVPVHRYASCLPEGVSKRADRADDLCAH